MIGAKLLSKQDMLTDDKNSDNKCQAFLLRAEHNKSGKAVYVPIISARYSSSMWLLVLGNCPTRSDGMGANDAKLFVMSKAAGIDFYRISGVAVNVVLADFSIE